MRVLLILTALAATAPAFAQQDYSATVTETLEEPAYIPDVSAGVRSQVSARLGFVFYRVCADARLAGRAPLHRGDPGYRPALDADGDGVACEPYAGRSGSLGNRR